MKTKQIVLAADKPTYDTIKSLADLERRTMGNQVLAMLAPLIKSIATPPAKKARVQTNINHA